MDQPTLPMSDDQDLPAVKATDISVVTSRHDKDDTPPPFGRQQDDDHHPKTETFPGRYQQDDQDSPTLESRREMNSRCETLTWPQLFGQQQRHEKSGPTQTTSFTTATRATPSTAQMTGTPYVFQGTALPKATTEEIPDESNSYSSMMSHWTTDYVHTTTNEHQHIPSKREASSDSNMSYPSQSSEMPYNRFPATRPKKQPILEGVEYEPNDEPPYPGNPIEDLPSENLFEWYATYVRYLFRVVNATATLHHYADKYYRRRHRRLGFTIGIINGFGSVTTLMSSSDIQRTTFQSVNENDTLLARDIISGFALVTGILLLLNVVFSTLHSYLDYNTQASYHYDLYKRLIELRDTIVHMDIDPYANPIENVRLLEEKYHKLMVQAPYMNSGVMREVVKKWRVIGSSEDLHLQKTAWTARFTACVSCSRQDFQRKDDPPDADTPMEDTTSFATNDTLDEVTIDVLNHHRKAKRRNMIRRIDANRIPLMDQQVVIEWIAERMRLYNVRHPSLLQYALAYRRYKTSNKHQSSNDNHANGTVSSSSSSSSSQPSTTTNYTISATDMYGVGRNNNDDYSGSYTAVESKYADTSTPTIHKNNNVQPRLSDRQYISFGGHLQPDKQSQQQLQQQQQQQQPWSIYSAGQMPSYSPNTSSRTVITHPRLSRQFPYSSQGQRVRTEDPRDRLQRIDPMRRSRT
jgi:hypothetical protein